VKIALIGSGNVARALARLLDHKRGEHPFGIAGIRRRNDSESLEEFLRRTNAEVLVELSTLNPQTGEPAATHVRTALGLGIHVVTANKGPIAFAYHELAAIARERGVRLLHESVVMDGAPVFNFVRNNLRGVRILGFTGVLNSTTNVVIEAMEQGASFEEGIARARELGIAEANADYDIRGWDAAVKTAALANVLMDARITPADVEREGIEGLTLPGQGKTVRLVSRAERGRFRVRREVLLRTDALATVRGTSNLILFHTDLMGTVGTISISPGVEQTAYGVYADLLELIR
jgi:homoserine dehydrogenase